MATLPAVPAPATRAPAAAALLALAGNGMLTDDDLRTLGKAVLGYDLEAAVSLPRGGRWARVPPSVMLGALRFTLALAFKAQPKGIRFDRDWLKTTDGKKDRTVVPANLAPDRLAQWIRLATLRFAWDSVADARWTLEEVQLPARYQRITGSPAASAYSNQADMAPYVDMIARDTLDALLALPSERGPGVLVSLRVQGYTTTEIASRLGVTDRTIRRDLCDLHKRATDAGIFDGTGPVRPSTNRNGANNANPPTQASAARGGALVGHGRRRAWGIDKDLAAMVRPMTPDEAADMRTGYPASRYRRLAAASGRPPERKQEGTSAKTIDGEGA